MCKPLLRGPQLGEEWLRVEHRVPCHDGYSSSVLVPSAVVFGKRFRLTPPDRGLKLRRQLGLNRGHSFESFVDRNYWAFLAFIFKG